MKYIRLSSFKYYGQYEQKIILISLVLFIYKDLHKLNEDNNKFDNFESKNIVTYQATYNFVIKKFYNLSVIIIFFFSMDSNKYVILSI